MNGSTFHAQSTTDSGGNYSLNVANGNWTVNVNCCNCNNCRCLNTSIYQCPNSQNVNISNGSANNINFIASLAGSFAVPGSVKDNNNRAIVGVKVYANNGSGNNLTTTTDGNGNFSFNLGNGNWDLSVDCSQLNSLGYACPSDQVVAVPNGGLSGVIFIVSPCGTLQVSTTSLPDGMANFAYYYNDAAGYQLQNSGCNPPFTWSLTPGSQALPAGLSLAANGWISGMPTTTGTNYFSLRLTDTKANSADQLLSVLVWPTVQITNAAVPNGSAGLAYSATLGATGGAGGYFGWSISSGSLPPGLSISDGPGWTGLISGMPTQIGMFSFTVSLIDNSGYSPQRAYSITIRNASPTITTTNLPSGTVGVPYSTQLKAVGGTPPLNWSTAPGSQPLPVALTLSTNGLISGVPSVNGIFSFIVRVTDANALSSTAPVTLTVNPGLTLSWPVSVGKQFRIQVQGTAPGQNYMLQMSTNLASTKWISLYATNAPGTSFLFTDPSATNPMAFYRVMTAP